MTALETALCLTAALILFALSLAAGWSWLARSRLVAGGLGLWLLPALVAAWKAANR